MSDRQRFETLVLPHLDAGYNLARWLLRDEPAEEEVETFARLWKQRATAI